MKKPYRKDLTGRIFGRLIVVEYDGIIDGCSLWYCRCNACGQYKSIRGASLLAGTSKTCGCSYVTHGLTRGGKPPEYKSWVHIKGRCLNPDNAAYAAYGGRGITVCERWQNSFADFLADVGPRPSNKHSIERINNNGNYEPGNCRWATSKEQNNNRRSSRLIHAFGKTQTLSQWAYELNIVVGTLWSRIYKYGMTPEEALKKSI